MKRILIIITLTVLCVASAVLGMFLGNLSMRC